MNENYIEQVERYVNGEMNESEKARFETALETDHELSSTLRVYEILDKGMRSEYSETKAQAALNVSLGNLNAKYFQPNQLEKDSIESKTLNAPATGKLVRFSAFKKLAIAATILAFVSIIATWFLIKDATPGDGGNRTVINDLPEKPGTNTVDPSASKPSAGDNTQVHDRRDDQLLKKPHPNSSPAERLKELYAAYRSKPDMQENAEGPLQLVVEAIENDRTAKALEFVESVNADAITRGGSTDAQRITIFKHYYKGYCLLELNQTAAALNELEQAKKINKDPGLRAALDWYQALAFLKLNNRIKVRQSLQEIINNQKAGAYQQKATRLLAELNR